jgi:hypothetical protein
MDPDPIEIEDVGILVALLTLFFLMVWIIRLLRNLDQTRIDKVCSGGPSVSLTQGELSNLIGGDTTDWYGAAKAIKKKVGIVPPTNLNIKAKLKCDE